MRILDPNFGVINNPQKAEAWSEHSYACYYQSPAHSKNAPANKLQKNKPRYTFISGTDDPKLNEKFALINVNGKDVFLTRKTKKNSSIKPDSVNRTYIGDGMILTVAFHTVHKCQPKEGCEGNTKDAVLTLQSGKMTKTIRTSGYCAI